MGITQERVYEEIRQEQSRLDIIFSETNSVVRKRYGISIVSSIHYGVKFP